MIEPQRREGCKENMNKTLLALFAPLRFHFFADR